MGGGTTTSTTKQEEDPQIVSRKLDAYDTAKARSESLMAPYSGQRVAGFDPATIDANRGLLDIANSNPGMGTFNQAKGIFSDLGAYNPQTITPKSYSPSLFKGMDLSAYTNPYDSQVIDNFLSDNERARQMQRVKDAQSASASKAFGGSRHGVADSLTNEAFGRTAASTLASLRQGGFDRATALAGADLERQNAGNQFNIANDFSAQQQNVANDFRGADIRAQAAAHLRDYSDAELARALQLEGIKGAVGLSRQQQEQALLDATMQAYEDQRMQPVAQQSILTSALSGLPTMMSSTTTQKQSSDILGGIFGTLLGGAKVAGGLGWQPFGK